MKLEDFLEKWYCGYKIVNKLKSFYPALFECPILGDIRNGCVSIGLPGGPNLKKDSRNRWVITVWDFDDLNEILEELGMDIYDVVAPNGIYGINS